MAGKKVKVGIMQIHIVVNTSLKGKIIRAFDPFDKKKKIRQLKF